jgi:hypothetical protein
MVEDGGDEVHVRQEGLRSFGEIDRVKLVGL